MGLLIISFVIAQNLKKTQTILHKKITQCKFTCNVNALKKQESAFSVCTLQKVYAMLDEFDQGDQVSCNWQMKKFSLLFDII